MHDTVRIDETPGTRRGPTPCVYVIIRIIGCRIHWRTQADGWQPELSLWALSWWSKEREEAYKAAQRCRGLLVKYTADEWNAAMDAWRKREALADAADQGRHG